MGSGKSIGLKNVNKRLFLSYGASGCLQIISEPGKGTSVSFRIEIEKEEGDGDFKAVLVDDEENVRYLLADLLESFHLGIEVTGQAGDGRKH